MRYTHSPFAPRRNLWCIAALALVACGLAACGTEGQSAQTREPAQAIAQKAPDPADTPISAYHACLERGLRSDTLSFRSGDTLSRLLARAKVAQTERSGLISALGAVFDMGEFRSGRELHLLTDGEGRCIGLDYPLSFDRDLCAWRTNEGYEAQVLGANLRWSVRRVDAVDLGRGRSCRVSSG